MVNGGTKMTSSSWNKGQIWYGVGLQLAFFITIAFVPLEAVLWGPLLVVSILTGIGVALFKRLDVKSLSVGYWILGLLLSLFLIGDLEVYLYGLLGFFITWVVIVLVAIIVRFVKKSGYDEEALAQKFDQRSREHEKKIAQERQKQDATVLKTVRTFSSPDVKKLVVRDEADSTLIYLCPFCKGVVNLSDKTCPHCGTSIPEKEHKIS